MTKKATAGVKKAHSYQTEDAFDRTLLPALTEQRRHFDDRPPILVREALLLNYRAFDKVKAAKDPLRRGLTILGLILLLLLVARGLQLLLGYLTTPRFDVLSADILDQVTGLNWYTEQATANPAFAQQFALAYEAVWQLIRVVGGFPSALGTIVALVSTAGSLLLGWLLYGSLAHVLARWFGGNAPLKQFLGPLALSYAPMLLFGLAFIPGLEIGGTLVFLYMLTTKFIAIRRTYLLSPGYSLAVLLAPYAFGIALVAILVALSIGVGLGQIPYLDPILNFFTG